jgi:DNA-binding XRE family transcriptional regulator
MTANSPQANWRPSQVRALRILAKLSQGDLGDLIGVSRVRIAQLENSFTKPTRVLCKSLDMVRELQKISQKAIDKEIANNFYLTRKD